jgi:hypothetical protein
LREAGLAIKAKDLTANSSVFRLNSNKFKRPRLNTQAWTLATVIIQVWTLEQAWVEIAISRIKRVLPAYAFCK